MKLRPALFVTTLVIVVALFLLVLFIGRGVVSPPSSTQAGCIEPPPTLAKDQRGVAMEIAAKLATLKADPKLKLDFSRVVEQNFATLSDSNAALFLFLKAIECILNDPNAPIKPDSIRYEEAKTLMEIVRRKWGTENKVQSASGPLSPFEAKLIQNAPSAESEFIQSTLKKYGYLPG
jgi:hypothetical protein